MANDAVELKRAVYAAEPDWLFRKFLCTLKETNFYDKPELRKSYTKSKRDKIINFLKVKNNVKPIVFNDMKYSKSQHEDCMFMFLDDELRVIGFLKGNEWNEKWREFEAYQAGTAKSNYVFDVAKNRKNMTEKAAYILMFTPEMMNKKQVYKPKAQSRKRDYHVEQLENRLKEYKKNKHGNMTYDQTINLSKNILKALVDSIGTDAEHEIVKKCRAVYSFSDNISNVISKVSEIVKDYRYNYEQNERQIKHYTKALGEEEFKKNRNMYLSHDPHPYLIALVDYKKIIIGGNS